MFAAQQKPPSMTKRTARSATARDPLLYKSTYNGPCEDSDYDPHHITMPFKHSEQIHREILEGD